MGGGDYLIVFTRKTVSVCGSCRMGLLYGHPELAALIVSFFLSAVNGLEAYIVEAVVYRERM